MFMLRLHFRKAQFTPFGNVFLCRSAPAFLGRKAFRSPIYPHQKAKVMTIQTTSPSQAVVTSVGGVSNGGTENSARPVIAGSADVGTTVNVYDGVRLLGTAVVGTDGTWSLTPGIDLKNAVHSFFAIAVDSAGNWGASSEPARIVVAAPVAVAATAHEVSGLSEAASTITGETASGLQGVRALSLAGDTHVVAQDQGVLTQEQHMASGVSNANGAVSGHDAVDLVAKPAAYSTQLAEHIDGGHGMAAGTQHSTSDHQLVDFVLLSEKIAAVKVSGMDVSELGGTANTLKPSLTDVLDQGDTDLFQKGGKQQIMLNGTDGDKVDLSNAHIAGLAEGEWQQHGTAQAGGVTYNVYEYAGAHTDLLVQQGVQIVVH